MIILSENDRKKFAVWLEQEAESLKTVSVQMEKLKVPEVVISKYQTEAAAHQIVASKLRTTKTDTAKL